MFLFTLACDCQFRGGVSLEDAHSLYNAKENSTQSKFPISKLKRIVLCGQWNGSLTLQEAWSAYNAFCIIEKGAGDLQN